MVKRSISGLSPIRTLIVLAVLGVTAAAWVISRPDVMGPTDGRDLPGEDTARVRVGDLAPDFRLPSFDGDVVALSDFRGDKDVVLIFYRGHW